MLALAGLLAPGAGAATGEFEALASSPEDLTSIAADSGTHLIYAQENAGTKFFAYDPRTDVWTELAEAPLNSGNNGGATYLGGKIYTSYTQDPATLGVYDIASNTWTTIPNPLGSGTADITSVGGKIYMAAGEEFVSYDPASETTATLAEPVVGFEQWGGLQPFNGKIYGDSGNGHKGFSVYDVASDTWTELPELPNGAVAGSALDPITGTYEAYGSYGGENLYAYDIAGGSWTTLALPFEVGDGGLVWNGLPGKTGIYLIQGEQGTGFTRFSTPEPAADLSLSLSPSVASTSIGGEITYTATVINAGPQEAANVTLADTLPADVSFVSVAPSQGACSGTAAIACSLGTLASGASATVLIKVKATAAGSAVNTAKAASETADPNPANNTAGATVTVAAAVAAPAPAPQAQSQKCVVPAMRGLTLTKVKAKLAGAHCKLGKVVFHYNEAKKGTLVQQSRHQGTVLPVGSSVSIWLSRGHHPRHHTH
jgi:uncharacterized repeat protein (TIGR01451 family)